MNIKRLDVPPWFIHYINRESTYENYTRISPIIGKNGWYSKNKFSWAEYDGKAIQMDYDMFIFELRLLIVSEIDIKIIRALQIISKTKYCTKSQRQLVRDYNDYILLFNATTKCNNFRRRKRLEAFNKNRT
jgi:hypothetical protein